jgi:hypothetical protein
MCESRSPNGEREQAQFAAMLIAKWSFGPYRIASLSDVSSRNERAKRTLRRMLARG